MSSQVIEHVYTQLAARLMCKWQDVPKVLVCFCLHSAMTAKEIKETIGFFDYDHDIVNNHYELCQEVIATLNVTITYKLAA